jgi:uncharacterized membrane protein
MIVCDDHFLNDKSMLKTMLRIFEKRIIRIFRFRSISWIASFLSFRREARDVYMYVCVCVCVCFFVEREIKSSFSNEVFFWLSLKSFFVMWTVETIICEYKKREKRSLFRWQNSNILLLNFILFSITILFIFWNALRFIFSVSSFYFVRMIAFNFFSFESYYVYDSTLIIKTCKRMIKIARYMIQRKFANYMIKRQNVINERLKQVWSWIKQNKI